MKNFDAGDCVMAQWDVYANPSARSREEMPYIVDIQSDLLAGLSSRLVIPLGRTRVTGTDLPRRLCPLIDVRGEVLVALPHDAASLDVRLLKRPVSSARSNAHELVDALDAVISGI